MFPDRTPAASFDPRATIWMMLAQVAVELVAAAGVTAAWVPTVAATSAAVAARRAAMVRRFMVVPLSESRSAAFPSRSAVLRGTGPRETIVAARPVPRHPT